MAGRSKSDNAFVTEGKKPKVVYVMGAGRSGSTILGVTLGNCADVFFAGELDKWLARSGVPPRGGSEQTRFWSEVRTGVEDDAGLFGAGARYLDRSSAMLDPRKWALRRRLRQPYRRAAQELYIAIKRATGATHIVDTSHYPLRARELQRVDGIDLYILFLVRDPQSVVASFGRSDVPEPRFNMPTTNAYLWLTYLLSLFVFLSQPRERRIFARHEHFLADPESVVRQILSHVDSLASPPARGPLQTGVPFQGNRLIGSETVTLKQGVTEPTARSLTTTLIQLPWSVIFSRLRPATKPSVPPEREPTLG